MLGKWFPPRKKLSPHFDWYEVIRNSGYDHVPLGPMLLPNLRLVRPRDNARLQASYMETVRIHVNFARKQHGLQPTGINVLSWARSWSHNKQVGGARDSQHLYFRACDIALEEIDRLCPWQGGRKEFDTIIGTIFANGGIGSYPAGNRHVDSRGSRARWTAF